MSDARPMTKSQFVAHIAERFGVSRQVAADMIQELANLAYAEAKRSGSFLLPGIGKLVLKDRAARMGRNPATGEAIQIPAKTVLNFRIAKAAKDEILS